MKTEVAKNPIARAYHSRVHVREYVRYRLGRLEHVRAHTRGWPGQQMTLPLH